MTDHAIAGPRRTSASERHLAAETRLWKHHGLAPIERFVELREPRARLRLLEVGSGPPLLLVHGTIGPGSYASLLETMPGRRAIVLDRPGWGGSDPVDFSGKPYRRFVAGLLRGVLDALGLDRVDVVGGSVGGLWALSLAEHEPARVGRVVLLGGGPLVDDVSPPPFIRLVRSPLGALVVRMPFRADRLRSILRQNGHGASLDAGRIPDEFLAWRMAAANDTPAMRHERDMIRAILGRSGWRPGGVLGDDDLARIQAPVLMVYGSADSMGTVALWRRVTGTLPHGELAVVDGAGHHPWFDDPATVANEVGRFLAGSSQIGASVERLESVSGR